MLLSFLGNRDLYSLLKQANHNKSIIYDCLDNKEYKGKLFKVKDKMRLVADTLTKHGFTYDAQNDTVVICLGFRTDLVETYRIGLCKKYYFFPVEISGYSSKTTLRLSWQYSGSEFLEFFSIDTYELNEPLPILVKKGDKEKIKYLHTKYPGDNVADFGGQEYYRIVLKQGEIISATKWYITLDPLSVDQLNRNH